MQLNLAHANVTEAMEKLEFSEEQKPDLAAILKEAQELRNPWHADILSHLRAYYVKETWKHKKDQEGPWYQLTTNLYEIYISNYLLPPRLQNSQSTIMKAQTLSPDLII